MRYLTIACVWLVACGGDSAPPPTPRDGGTLDGGGNDGGTPTDGGEMDGAVEDGAVPDGGGDDGGRDGGRDAGSFDAGNVDGGSYSFGSECFDGEGMFDLCLCNVPECDPSAAAPCAAGLRCQPDGCGERHTCQPGGQGCAAPEDCPSGSLCFGALSLDGSRVDLCLRPEGGCADSRDCASGYACEDGACVNRRVSCDVGCPFGFYCNDADPWARPYCARVSRRCSSFAGACPPFFSCVDVDGDGSSECRRNGEACDSNEDCGAAGDVCGFDPVAKALACQPQGPCSGAGDCGTGFVCEDLWGDGVRECVPSGGTCDAPSDCGANALCGAPAGGGPPTCVGGAT
ncbi:MAG: hypothetical protein H6724_13165 [Sandaracinus sp.]|nr:hypothetical protein [Sandaracinus sp.]